jgi:DNA-binding PucR family transcriptional regulator
MAINTLKRLVETLGRGVIDVVCAPNGLAVEIHDVVVHDFVDPLDVKEGDLVLGVSVGPGPDTTDLVTELADKGIAGLVLKTPALSDASVVEAAEDAGLIILSVPAGASWSQIVQLAQSVLSHGAVGGDEVHGLGAGDLFTLADAISELIDAPVTIEDRLSRVLAYSARQDEADPARAETIVGRRVPDRYLRKLEERGAFRRLREETGGVYIEALDEGVLPRLAVAVRAGDEMLGSIWAAVPERPSEEVEKAFVDTSKVAALHLLRHRVAADVERSLQAELLASILEGTGGANEAAVRLGLTGIAYRVLAAWITDTDEAEETRARTQLRDVLAVHLSTFRVRGAAATLGGIVYALIATGDDVAGSEDLALRIAKDLSSRSGQHAVPSIGIGGHATGLDEVPRSRREAEEALRVMRRDPDRTVAVIEQVRLHALLARFSESAAVEKDIYERKIVPLVKSDSRRKTAYVETLRSYFDHFGDYTAAAAALQIHPNTLRYRLRKAQELSGVRLDDPDERLALMLLLRLVAARA